MADACSIIKRPLVTEKNMHRVETRNTYCFEVAGGANKIEIRRAVEDLFKVKVLRVNTVIKKGKTRRFGWHTGVTPSCKKALVTLAEGYKIEIL